MKIHDGIGDRLRAFIEAQPMFFVATAPAGEGGHVNLSPKGMKGTFAVLDEHTVAYLDWHGSGAETVAHLRENGRITVMFCAFDGPPTIVRLYGHGRFTAVTDPGFDAELARFPDAPEDVHAARAVITIDVTKVTDTCGFSVPRMTYDGDRDLLIRAHERRDAEALTDYRAAKNRESLDGLPAFAE